MTTTPNLARAIRRARWLTLGIAMLAMALGPTARSQSAELAQMLLEVEAHGAFGVVAGQALSPDDALPDPASLAVLDAYARGTGVTFRPTSGTLGDWTLTAVAAADRVLPLGTGSGPASVVLDATGLFLVRLDGRVQPADGGTPSTGSWVWRIGVPDRDLPEAEDSAPPPRIRLASGDQQVRLERGSGCYLGTCGDIGGVPPTNELPTIRTVAGAPLVLDLADGSSFTSWRVEVTPADDPVAGPVVVTGSVETAPQARAVFAAPAAGAWQVLVHVTFDHERGSFDGYARLLLVDDA
ncbi:MAG: hypothetical protein KF809_05015 [Chloroflexi bacterium]|nr:hypothetical protein [Chloroflexota bacterium]